VQAQVPTVVTHLDGVGVEAAHAKPHQTLSSQLLLANDILLHPFVAGTAPHAGGGVVIVVIVVVIVAASGGVVIVVIAAARAIRRALAVWVVAVIKAVEVVVCSITALAGVLALTANILERDAQPIFSTQASGATVPIIRALNKVPVVHAADVQEH